VDFTNNIGQKNASQLFDSYNLKLWSAHHVVEKYSNETSVKLKKLKVKSRSYSLIIYQVSKRLRDSNSMFGFFNESDRNR